VRILDVHPANDQRLALLLPAERPLFVREVEEDQEWSLPPGRELELQGLTPHKRRVDARGAEHEAFSTLFRKPFDALAVESFRDELKASGALTPPKPLSPWWRRSLGLAAPVLGGLGGTFYLLAEVEHGKLTERTSAREARVIADRVQARDRVGLGLCITAGAALLGYTVWTLFFHEDKETQYYWPNLFGPGSQPP